LQSVFENIVMYLQIIENFIVFIVL